MEQNEVHDFRYLRREVFIKNFTLLALLLALFSIFLTLFPNAIQLSSFSDSNTSGVQLTDQSTQLRSIPLSADSQSDSTQYPISSSDTIVDISDSQITLVIPGQDDNSDRVGIIGGYGIMDSADSIGHVISSSNITVTTNGFLSLLYSFLPQSAVSILLSVLYYAPVFLMAIYVFLLRPKGKAAVIVPIIYGILAANMLLSSSLPDGLFSIALILVTISAAKDFPNRIFLYIATGLGIISNLYNFVSQIDYFKLFFQAGAYQSLFNMLAHFLSSISLLLALYLLGINWKKPETISNEEDSAPVDEPEEAPEEIVEIS